MESSTQLLRPPVHTYAQEQDVLRCNSLVHERASTERSCQPVELQPSLRPIRITGLGGAKDPLLSLLDSVPFTPSQGVRSPSPTVRSLLTCSALGTDAAARLNSMRPYTVSKRLALQSLVQAVLRASSVYASVGGAWTPGERFAGSRNIDVPPGYGRSIWSLDGGLAHLTCGVAPRAPTWPAGRDGAQACRSPPSESSSTAVASPMLHFSSQIEDSQAWPADSVACDAQTVDGRQHCVHGAPHPSPPPHPVPTRPRMLSAGDAEVAVGPHGGAGPFDASVPHGAFLRQHSLTPVHGAHCAPQGPRMQDAHLARFGMQATVYAHQNSTEPHASGPRFSSTQSYAAPAEQWQQLGGHSRSEPGHTRRGPLLAQLHEGGWARLGRSPSSASRSGQDVPSSLSRARPESSSSSQRPAHGQQRACANSRRQLGVKAESEISASSAGSHGPGSPGGAAKSRVDVRISPDGQLLFNARQRRTLRRALQRQHKAEFGKAGGPDFAGARALSVEERRMAVGVVEQHIGRALPMHMDVDALVTMLLSLGTADAGGH